MKGGREIKAGSSCNSRGSSKQNRSEILSARRRARMQARRRVSWVRKGYRKSDPRLQQKMARQESCKLEKMELTRKRKKGLSRLCVRYYLPSACAPVLDKYQDCLV